MFVFECVRSPGSHVSSAVRGVVIDVLQEHVVHLGYIFSAQSRVWGTTRGDSGCQAHSGGEGGFKNTECHRAGQ